MSASDIYDALAPHYREYAEKRTAYLRAVDRFVLNNIQKGSVSLLDVGAGDGVRGMAIARESEIKKVVLSDASFEMVKRCNKLHPTDVWHIAAEDLPSVPEQFDVILCLWNVLGHLSKRTNRVQALSRMRALLSERGRIFLDVNNRHNAAAYGWLRVMARILIDYLFPNEIRGDSSYDWVIGGRTFPAMGHLFTPLEVETLIRDSGLILRSRVAVNYSTGKTSNARFKGQLVYELSRV